MRLAVLLLTSLALTGAFTATADAGLSKAEFRERSWAHLHGYKEARTDRCRPVRWHGFRTPRGQIAPGQRWYNLYRWRTRKWRAIRQSSKCLPTSNIWIIRAVFPDTTENAALNVAYCESAQVTGWARAHLAYNPASGVAGLFQIHPLWGLGRSAYDPWVNARFAAKLSKGGTDWSHWACKPWANPYGPEPF